MNTGFDIIYSNSGIDRIEMGFEDIFRINALTGAVDTNIASVDGFSYWMGQESDGGFGTHAEYTYPGIDNIRYYTEGLDPRLCVHVD